MRPTDHASNFQFNLTGVNMKKLFLTLTALVASISAQQLIAQTQINQSNVPYIITSSGSYILAGNLTIDGSNDFAIRVEASNVTLNLNGFTITGPCPVAECNTGTTGIYALPGYYNTTVANGQVTGFAYGVDIQSGNLHDLNVTYGEFCIDAANAIIRHNVISNCGAYGIYAQNCSISDNIVSQASVAGIYGNDSTISNNTSTSNMNAYGIEAYGGLVSGNTSMHNGTGDDIYLGSDAVTTKTNACTAGAC
jgi:hypothetical protein